MNWIAIKKDTLSTALKYPGSVSLLFASHKRAGGGYKNHEQGQEEHIARRTDLVERLQPYKSLYGDNRKPFYILLTGVKISGTKETRDFICCPAPVAHLYPNPLPELEERISKICELVKAYPVFITGAWGCGFFGNKLEDVERLFKKYATNETVIMAIK
jgi:uncharacterized protein (TIGR02452 family)